MLYIEMVKKKHIFLKQNTYSQVQVNYTIITSWRIRDTSHSNNYYFYFSFFMYAVCAVRHVCICRTVRLCVWIPNVWILCLYFPLHPPSFSQGHLVGYNGRPIILFMRSKTFSDLAYPSLVLICSWCGWGGGYTSSAWRIYLWLLQFGLWTFSLT